MAFMLEPEVVQLYCGYWEKATICEAPSSSTSCKKGEIQKAIIFI
jgi:hypothetical protein